MFIGVGDRSGKGLNRFRSADALVVGMVSYARFASVRETVIGADTCCIWVIEVPAYLGGLMVSELGSVRECRDLFWMKRTL